MTESEINKWHDVVGQHIKAFIKSKWKNQKQAADQLMVSESRLSRIISGERTPNREFTLRLIRWGFDKKHFEEYDSLEDINQEDLTKQDIFELIRERRIFAHQERELIDRLLSQVESLMKAVQELTDENKRLLFKLEIYNTTPKKMTQSDGQKELARLRNINKRTVKQWEKNRKNELSKDVNSEDMSSMQQTPQPIINQEDTVSN